MLHLIPLVQATSAKNEMIIAELIAPCEGNLLRIFVAEKFAFPQLFLHNGKRGNVDVVLLTTTEKPVFK